MKKLLGLMAASLAVLQAFGGNVYVDANAAAGGDGSQAAPFQTIRAGVNAAGAGDTVFVRGGTERAYNLADCDDAVLMDEEGMKLVGCDANWSPATHYRETDKMIRFNVASDYASQSKTKKGSTTWDAPIVVSANGCSVSGLYCLFGNKSFAAQNNGGTGLVYVTADDVTVGASYFKMTSGSASYGSVASVVYGGTTSSKAYPQRVRIEKIYCWMGKYRACVGVFSHLGNGSGIYESFVENLDTLFGGPHATGVFLNVISNICLNCANAVDNYTNYLIHKGGNGYPSGGEIAYNRIIHDNGGAKCHRFIGHGDGYNGCWNKDPISIHHNTIVGYDEVFSAPLYGNCGDSWMPQIFDNIIVAPNGKVFVEEAKALWRANIGGKWVDLTSSCRPGSTFLKNATFCPTFVSGTATSLAGYDLAASLTGEETTIELAATPVFLNTDDPTSEDFYRLNDSANPWVKNGSGGSEGTYPKYIGALEPTQGAKPGEFFYLDSFTQTATAYFAPAEVTFTVTYGMNGGAVTVSWDFDGDGVVDASSVEASTEALTQVSVKRTYATAGIYTPRVKIVDSATGKELSANLETPQLPIVKETVYVDANATAGGDGTLARPYNSIVQGLAVSGNGSTVYVRGGADRLYTVASDADVLTVAGDEMTLCAYGDEGRARLRVTDTFQADGGTKNVLTITGACVTLQGLDFTYGPLSLKGGLLLISYSGKNLTIDDCRVELTARMSWNGSGHNGIICATESTDPTGLLVRNSVFVNIDTARHDYGVNIITVDDNATLVGNVFTNCAGTAHSCFRSGRCSGLTFVSNVVFVAEDHTLGWGAYGSQYAGIMRSGNNGIGSGEIAHNVFVGRANQPLLGFAYNGWPGPMRIHHNVIRNVKCLVGYGADKDQAASEKARFEVFDNVIEAESLFIEDKPEQGMTMFKEGSFFRNNAYLAPSGTVTGCSTQIAGYKFDQNMTLTDNVVLSAPAVFINTNDCTNVDFYRPKQSKNRTWAYKKAAWTDEGRYPAYVGAVEPVWQGGMTIVIR